jgi:hypothetical protein
MAIPIRLSNEERPQLSRFFAHASELGGDRERFESPQALKCYAGTASVSYQSGSAPFQST